MTMIEVRHPLDPPQGRPAARRDLSTKSFREITAEIGRLLAYEATADFPLEPATVEGWAGPVQVGADQRQEGDARCPSCAPASACSTACSTRFRTPRSASSASPATTSP